MQRLGALAAWLTVEYAAWVICPMAPRNAWYYPIASVFDVMSISIFLAFKPTRLIVDLVKLTGIQLVTQAIGWALYALHFHPTALVYNWLNWASEVAIFLRFFIVGKRDGDVRIPANYRLFHLGANLGRRQNSGAHQ